MKYYLVSDIHGFFSEFHFALTQAGFFNDPQPHKLVLLGDLFDRGKEAVKVESFVLDLIEKDAVILIRGNHEDLFEEFVTIDRCSPFKHHMSNGTFDTALQLTGLNLASALCNPNSFVSFAKQTPFFCNIIPRLRNFYETKHYIFVHGWIPCIHEKTGYSHCSNWHSASDKEWAKARWYNGIDAAMTVQEDKIIVCGHWHTSYGHSKYLNDGDEFGSKANFKPYYNKGIIAIDGCTAYSGIVNVVVLDDDELIK